MKRRYFASFLKLQLIWDYRTTVKENIFLLSFIWMDSLANSMGIDKPSAFMRKVYSYYVYQITLVNAKQFFFLCQRMEQFPVTSYRNIAILNNSFRNQILICK